MIVACPACDARYDLPGSPIGSRARCRCGTEFTIQAPPHEAGTLACPQCGANVPESSPQCAYCHAALLLKACPRCLARVFQGHKHCPECGTALDVAAETTTSRRQCPRCHVAMTTHLIGDVAIDDCTRCGGSFLDRATIERVLAERRSARADAIVGVYGDGGDAPLPAPPGPMYVKCPDCATLMNRKQFATGSHVVLDVCRDHGTWFDPHELPRVIRFVMSGGLEQAAQRDIADQQAKAKRMLDDARAAQIQLMHTAQLTEHHGPAYGSLIADVLFQLWK